MTNRLPSRRQLLQLSLSALVLPTRLLRAATDLKLTNSPFILGVASGCPTSHGVVLWTRLLSSDAAFTSDLVIPVQWEIASDANMKVIIQRGVEHASPEWAHSIHTEVTGLKPDHDYWYRFTAAGHQSAIGKIRTAPAISAHRNTLRMAVVSCQKYENGFYTAYRQLLDEHVDLIIHVGDYIYEGTGGSDLVRGDGSSEAFTLAQYRQRYALYKSDADLQAAHAYCPWLMTWDDHEVSNDYGGDADLDKSGDEFIARRTSAYRAYYEHMPLPRSCRPQGNSLKLYGTYTFSSLLSIQMLDSRQYRSPRACPDQRSGTQGSVNCPDLFDTQRTKLGWQQEAWLARTLKQSQSQWNVLAQGTPMAHVNLSKDQEPAYTRDSWDGFQAARQRLLNTIAQTKLSNPVIVDGDLHAFQVANLNTQANRIDTPVIASEFTTTSISSPNFPAAWLKQRRELNPNLLLSDSSHHGYMLADVNNERMHVDLVTVSTITEQEAQRGVLASYVVESEKPGPVAV